MESLNIHPHNQKTNCIPSHDNNNNNNNNDNYNDNDNDIISPQIERCAFVEQTSGIKRKFIEARLFAKPHEEIKEVTEFLNYGNNSIISANQKILKRKKFAIDSSKRKVVNLEAILSKKMNKYITQFNKFPLITTSNVSMFLSKEKIQKVEEEMKENLPEQYMNVSRSRMILWYKALTNVSTEEEEDDNEFSCLSFFCIRSKAKTVKVKSKSDGPENNHEKSSNPFKSIIIDGKESKLYTVNQFPQKRSISEMKHSAEQTCKLETKLLSITKHPKSPTNYTDNFLSASKFSSSNNSSTLVFESIDFPFSLSCKKITFLLTDDIVKGILLNIKRSNCEHILHLFSFEVHDLAFLDDVYLFDIKLRSNFTSLINQQKIKFPILLNGNVFFPNLIFFRACEAQKYKLLPHPVNTPLLICQMLYDSFFEKKDTVKKINRQVLKEMLDISNTLGYESIIVNLSQIAEPYHLNEIIKDYSEMTQSMGYSVICNIIFVVNLREEKFKEFEEQFELKKVAKFKVINDFENKVK